MLPPPAKGVPVTSLDKSRVAPIKICLNFAGRRLSWFRNFLRQLVRSILRAGAERERGGRRWGHRQTPDGAWLEPGCRRGRGWMPTGGHQMVLGRSEEAGWAAGGKGNVWEKESLFSCCCVRVRGKPCGGAPRGGGVSIPPLPGWGALMGASKRSRYGHYRELMGIKSVRAIRAL